MTAETTAPCLICQSQTHHYFSKDYADLPAAIRSAPLRVEYHRCGNCGSVLSDTHRRMPDADWAQLNADCHACFEAQPPETRSFNQPPYADQALAVVILAANGLLDVRSALDYAAGRGTLAKVLKRYFGTTIRTHDKYLDPEGADGKDPLPQPGAWALVINSAMFEHVRDRRSLDEVNDFVAPGGVLMIHSVICETIPANPDWFYLAPPVHCAFHTNRSMDILMRQWGYAASIYAPKAKSWFLFKENHPRIGNLADQVARMNHEFQARLFLHKTGFVDFWKGF